MGELSKPIMSPVGVVYRSFHDSEGNALKFAEWAKKTWGGDISAQRIIGPGKKGFYESAMMAQVAPGAQNVKPRKDAPTEWMSSLAHAYILFNALEEPIVLYFHEHELFYKPKSTPPMIGYMYLAMDQ
jgi:hypothetical protein